MKSLDFVGGISSNHVEDSLVTARVVREPRIDLEDIILNNYYFPPLSNEGFDLVAGEYRIAGGGCGEWHDLW